MLQKNSRRKLQRNLRSTGKIKVIKRDGRRSFGLTCCKISTESKTPPELRKAHQANDFAVMAAYGFDRKITESECVAELMKRYQELVEVKK